jgi:hypothetical protein
MACLKERSGNIVDTTDFPTEWCDELVELVAALDPVLDPLPPEELEVDPGVFREELISYARGVFGLRKGAPAPALDFREQGRIEHTSYWIFETRDGDGDSLYLFVLRKGAVTEMGCAEQVVEYVPTSGNPPLERVVLTPAQAALLEFCTMDFALPRADDGQL